MHLSTLLLTLAPVLALATPAFQNLQSRGSSDATCGNVGAGVNKGQTCSSGGVGGSCCSQNGWCGDTPAYCGAGCQAQFGRCDAPNSGSPGGSTSNTARSRSGNVLYGGGGVYRCVNPGMVAMTFDDGPYLYTNNLLDTLASAGAKATFFVTGSNLDKGNIDDPSKGWDKVIQRMYNNGHQVASHTWSHQDLSAISEEARRNEMLHLEAALVKIIGRFPTYMRPPYSSCNGACQATLADLGYHIIYFDLDTDDYNQLGNIQNSKDNVDRAMAGTSPNSRSFLSIAHDIHPQTSNDLAPYMVRRFAEAGYRMVTLGECLGDPAGNWYRS